MFEQLYRMPQHAVAELCDILRPFLPQHTSPQQLPLMRKVCYHCCVRLQFFSVLCCNFFSLQVLITLGFYASGSYQRMLGRCIDCAVSQTTVSRCLREITTALNHEQILNRFIRFPSTREERAPIIQRFVLFPRILVSPTSNKFFYFPYVYSEMSNWDCHVYLVSWMDFS